MKCEECRACCSDDPRKSTHAQQAAAIVHLHGCRACYDWFWSPQRPKVKCSPAELAAQVKVLARDPECGPLIGEALRQKGNLLP